ncbi:hypothetical protein ACFZCU_43650 [Streptomyces canus]|uniref:hypothetical protein n=1 Tax=Streptomyces canus TaxID=58343 RepID=UPI0036EB7FB8
MTIDMTSRSAGSGRKLEITAAPANVFLAADACAFASREGAEQGLLGKWTGLGADVRSTSSSSSGSGVRGSGGESEVVRVEGLIAREALPICENC